MSDFTLTKSELNTLLQSVFATLCSKGLSREERMTQAKNRLDAYALYLDRSLPVYTGNVGEHDDQWLFMWIGTFRGTGEDRYTAEIVVYSEPGGEISSMKSRCGIRMVGSGGRDRRTLDGVIIERPTFSNVPSTEVKTPNPRVQTFLDALRVCLNDLMDDTTLLMLRDELYLTAELLETYSISYPTLDPTGEKIMPEWDKMSQFLGSVKADSWIELRAQRQRIEALIPDYISPVHKDLQSSLRHAHHKYPSLSLDVIEKNLRKYTVYRERPPVDLVPLQNLLKIINGSLPPSLEKEVEEWKGILSPYMPT